MVPEGVNELDESTLDASPIENSGDRISSSRGEVNLVSCPAFEGRTFLVSLDLLVPYKGQPRLYFPEDEIDRLRDDISTNGQQIPMIVAPVRFEDGTLRFMLVDGERRYRALNLIEQDRGVTVNATITVRSYLKEGDLYSAAASTHKDSTSLNATDRVLMCARLYEFARVEAEQRGEELPVMKYAATAGIGYQDVFYGLRMQTLPPRVLELGLQQIIAHSGLVFLMNRMQESSKKGGSVFPEKEFVDFLELKLEKAKSGDRLYFSESDIQELYLRALIKVGRGDEALSLQIRKQLEAVLRDLARLVKDTDALFELVQEEDGDPDIIATLAGRTPKGFEKLQDVQGAVEGRVATFRTLMDKASALRKEQPQ
ncbi:MAG: ParB N-terminal domain-containing protein [Candidatus Gracilibacteria bacterium]|jgi:hypothetical protein